jgi:hypothetical protein
MVRRTPVFYANITRKLANKGMKNASEDLVKEFSSRVGSMPGPVTPPPARVVACQPTVPSVGHPFMATRLTGSTPVQSNAITAGR